MDPRITSAITEVQSLLNSILTNSTIDASQKSYFLSNYNSRLQSEIDSYMSTVKSQADSFVYNLQSLRQEISSNIPTV